MSGFRGRGRGNFRHFKEVPCEIFPICLNSWSEEDFRRGAAREIEGLGTCGGVKKDLQFALRYNRLQKYWNASPYFFGENDGGSIKTKKRGIERYSDRKLEKAKSKSHLSDFVRIEPDYFPAELCRGEKKDKHGAKRVRWNPDSDLKKLDLLEKLEKNQGDNVAEKKEGEGEDEDDDDRIEEEEAEYSDDGDYNQNIDFDDDEDDFNMPDDNDDEGGIF